MELQSFKKQGGGIKRAAVEGGAEVAVGGNGGMCVRGVGVVFTFNFSKDFSSHIMKLANIAKNDQFSAKLAVLETFELLMYRN